MTSSLAKLVCHREVLTRDLLVEDRESQRTRKLSSRGRLSSSQTQSFVLGSSTTSWPAGHRLSSAPLPRDSFDDPYSGALTDDELDRMRSPPLMQRSRTEGVEPRLSGEGDGGGGSEDELPTSRDDLRRRPSPSASTASLVPGSVRSVATPNSVSDLAESEDSSGVAGGVSPVEQTEEEAEDWTRTRGANRVSLVDYSKLSELATLREDRRGEGSHGSMMGET